MPVVLDLTGGALSDETQLAQASGTILTVPFFLPEEGYQYDLNHHRFEVSTPIWSWTSFFTFPQMVTECLHTHDDPERITREIFRRYSKEVLKALKWVSPPLSHRHGRLPSPRTFTARTRTTCNRHPKYVQIPYSFSKVITDSWMTPSRLCSHTIVMYDFVMLRMNLCSSVDFTDVLHRWEPSYFTATVWSLWCMRSEWRI